MRQILAIAFAVSIGVSAYAQLPSASEYAALMDIYQQMNGPNWKNKSGWESANPAVVQSVVGWYGIATDANGHVTHLDLDGILDYSYYTNPSGFQEYPGNGLSGPIPASIGNLVWLTMLNLGGNFLTSPLPVEIGNLTELTTLAAAQSHLGGSIPNSIGNCTKLNNVLLNNNQLTGAIPGTIGNLTELVGILLNYNQLSGSIPSQFGNLKKLQWFHIYANQLTGSIPPELGNMSGARSIGLHSNKLSGSIPMELGRMRSAQILYLSSNNLTGSIPDSLSRMSFLATLNLSANKLSGVIPPTLATISTLSTFEISWNKFTFSDVLQFKGTFQGNLNFGIQFVGETEDRTMPLGSSFTLSTNIDRNTTPASYYQWYRNGEPLVRSTSSHTLTITEADFVNSATARFDCYIENDMVPGGWVFAAPIQVTLGYLKPNYVRTITVLEEGKTNSAHLENPDPNDESMYIDYMYYGGLGRPVQSVQVQRTDYETDLRMPMVYDEFGRQTHSYLPYTTNQDGAQDGHYTHNQYILTENGRYKGLAKAFYSGSGEYSAADSIPFTTTIFEPSPLNRPLKEYGPGAAWSSSGYDRPVTHQYLSNIHSSSPTATNAELVILWKLNEQGMPAPETVAVSGYVESGGYYSSNQLSIKVTIDEDGHAVREYTNKQGQVILKKVQAVSTPNPSLNDKDAWACTYYIYDNLDNLVFVLQPEGYKKYLELSQN
jgi:hypothetical protein